MGLFGGKQGAKKGSKKNPHTGKMELPDENGRFSWGATVKQEVRKDAIKRQRDVTEKLGPNVESGGEQTLDEKLAPNRAEADSKRPPRRSMNMGIRLHLAQSIQNEIENAGYTPRWCIDKEDMIARYQEAYWEFHLDANGEQITRRAGAGGSLVLMKLPKDLWDQDKRLKKVERDAKYNNSNLLKAGFDAPNGSVLRDDVA